jgi:hypothetical protein
MFSLFENNLKTPPASTLRKYYLFLFIGKINNAMPPASITAGPTIWGKTGPPYVNRTYPITVPKPKRTYPQIFLIIFPLSFIHIDVDLKNNGVGVDFCLSSMHLLNELNDIHC